MEIRVWEFGFVLLKALFSLGGYDGIAGDAFYERQKYSMQIIIIEHFQLLLLFFSLSFLTNGICRLQTANSIQHLGKMFNSFGVCVLSNGMTHIFYSIYSIQHEMRCSNTIQLLIIIIIYSIDFITSPFIINKCNLAL